jgi:Skp family chaperone for outer membrane proteins
MEKATFKGNFLRGGFSVMSRTCGLFGVLIALCGGGTGVWAATAGVAAAPKFGIVDMQRALQATNDGQEAKKKLEADIAKKKSELDKRKAEIEKMAQEHEKKSAVLAEDVRAKREAEIGMEMRKFQESAMRTEGDLRKQERELMVPIVKGLREIVEEIAAKESFTMVFEKQENTVLFAQKDTDLTDRVIAEYASRFAKKKKK